MIMVMSIAQSDVVAAQPPALSPQRCRRPARRPRGTVDLDAAGTLNAILHGGADRQRLRRRANTFRIM